ncbi:VOC family protein [Ornithinimicrobium ciconiae]|uniref:VOC family protein n=1 Tax=Ornithinimicrobium ciconiae TaxID=2594265 RepID=A0A516G796_9MICO|nr:VOC family protein [Ornithinimicrobium ciconiae]QDO87240.1 VOC family protein [Ornithinimicrobium ciconiae]
MRPVIDHFGINCADLAASAHFYDRVLATLGMRRLLDHEVALGYGRDFPAFWIGSGAAEGPNRETHIAFHAGSEDEVRAFHEAALALGAVELHAPRLWPEYHEGYFGAFVRDPDGNNVEAVFHGGGPE